MRYTQLFLPVFILLASCSGQPADKGNSGTPDLDQTDAAAYGMPLRPAAIDTSPGWKQEGIKIMVTGTIFKRDGRTPAPGVLLYYYHTNTGGRYLHKESEARSLPPNSKGQTHGYIRGWVKTDSSGRYTIYTVRPGVYPAGDEPAHIHLTIKDPHAKMDYYIDDLVFDDDKLLTTAKKNRMENRGGRGILRMIEKDGLQTGEHNIILGLNIPGYPAEDDRRIQSGLSIGDDQPSFMPYHVYGPDRGSRACPVCKYGRYHGIVYFAGAATNWLDISQWLVFLEKESVARSKYLKVYLVYAGGNGGEKNIRMQQLAALGDSLLLRHIAITFVPSFDDKETEVYLNKINPLVKSTFVIYKNAEIIDKFIDLSPNETNFLMIRSVLDKTSGRFF